MYDAIAWSYNLLTPTQQGWLRALSIFMGGSTLEAAQSICSKNEPISNHEGLSIIAALVDASLVQMETTENGLPRYSMLEVICEYTGEQLRKAGEEDDYQRCHSEYYATMAEDAERKGSGQGTREAHLELESANGRAALNWAYERGEVTLGLRLATWFGYFWITRGQMSEANLWLTRMLALDESVGAPTFPAHTAIRTKALYYASRLNMHLGNRDRAFALAEEALVLAERAANHSDISYVLALLGSMALASEKEDQAEAYLTKSYTAAKLAKDAGDISQLSYTLLNLGELARKRGDLGQASEFLEEALSYVRSINMTWGIANILTMLGHLARQRHDYERAKVRYRESLALYHRLGNATYTAWCLEGIAAVACAEGSYQQAARLCAVAAVLRVGAQTPLPPAEQDDFDKVVMTTRAELDEQAFTEEWRMGLTMTKNDAISYTLLEPLA